MANDVANDVARLEILPCSAETVSSDLKASSLLQAEAETDDWTQVEMAFKYR